MRQLGKHAIAPDLINAALAARAVFELPDGEKWIEQVAGSTGLSVALLQQRDLSCLRHRESCRRFIRTRHR